MAILFVHNLSSYVVAVSVQCGCAQIVRRISRLNFPASPVKLLNIVEATFLAYRLDNSPTKTALVASFKVVFVNSYRNRDDEGQKYKNSLHPGTAKVFMKNRLVFNYLIATKR